MPSSSSEPKVSFLPSICSTARSPVLVPWLVKRRVYLAALRLDHQRAGLPRGPIGRIAVGQDLEHLQHRIADQGPIDRRLIVPDAVDLVPDLGRLGRVLQHDAAGPVQHGVGHQLPRRQKARILLGRQQIDVVVASRWRPPGP